MAKVFEFSIEKKGYNTEQVDTVIDDLSARNNYLKSRVSELEQKLDAARRLIRRFSESENGLRRSIADSKRAAATMLNDTKERSDTLLDKTRESCGEMISQLDMQIADRMGTVDSIKAEVNAFKDQLFSLYSSHIDMIEAIASAAENFTYAPDYTKISDAVDKFEASKKPDPTLPEFDEYPEESIFSQFEAEEDKSFEMNSTPNSKKEPSAENGEFTAEKAFEGSKEAPEEEIEGNDCEFRATAFTAENVVATPVSPVHADAERAFEVGEIDKAAEMKTLFEEENFTEAPAPVNNEAEEEEYTFEEPAEDDFFESESFEKSEENRETGEDEAFDGTDDPEAETDETGAYIDISGNLRGEVVTETPLENTADDEYFRFLENFINEDDSTLE